MKQKIKSVSKNGYRDSHLFYREIDVKKNLHLITPKMEHANDSLLWVKAHDVIQYMGTDFPSPSLKEEKQRIKKILTSTDAYSWMIDLDHKIIGNISVHSIAETSKKLDCKAGNMTILIGSKKYWGKGLGTEICSSVLTWAFEVGGFKAIIARALQENIASIKTLQKLKFQEEQPEPYKSLVNGKVSSWRNFKIYKE